jgi:hypothetical protein
MRRSTCITTWIGGHSFSAVTQSLIIWDKTDNMFNCNKTICYNSWFKEEEANHSISLHLTSHTDKITCCRRSQLLQASSIPLYIPTAGCNVLIHSRRGLRIFLFTAVSRLALGPTQPPIQWVPGALSRGVKRPGREADHSPPSSAEVKESVKLYLHSPIRLHGAVLS